MAKEFCEEYASSLNDLTFNSKPHITMLTMLAEENSQYAPQIVRVVEAHLLKVKPEAKLPTLYLIDSIMKNVGNVYASLFTQNIVSNFCNVFEKVDEKVRAQMYKLRQTWIDIFPNKKLYAIDMRIKEMDPAWPILAQPPQQPSIHVNPKFLKTAVSVEEPPRTPSSNSAAVAATVATKLAEDLQAEEMRNQLLAKQQELFRLQRQKLELELLQTQVLVEEQKRQLMAKEQQIQAQQQGQVDVQKQQQLTIQQLTNVAALAAVAASKGMTATTTDQTKLKKGMESHQSAGQAAESSLRVSSGPSGHLDSTTQAVMLNPLLDNNKTIDINALVTKKGFPSLAAAANQFQDINSIPQPFSVKNMSRMKSSIASNSKSVDKASKSGEVTKGVSNKARSGVVVKASKGSPLKKGTSKHQKSKKTPSPKKIKDRIKSSPESKGKTDSSSQSSSARSGSSGGMSAKSGGARLMQRGDDRRSRSGSVSPPNSRNNNRGGHKNDHWRDKSHSRSRSPGRNIDKRDRDDRKRSRRSPRREKENEVTVLDVKGKVQSAYKDVDLRTQSASSSSNTDYSSSPSSKASRDKTALSSNLDGGMRDSSEPPLKKTKSTTDSDLDEIFGSKDQDYRTIDHPVQKLSPIGERKGWAQYKASRPDEFKNPLRSRDNVDPFGFGRHDLDLRGGSPWASSRDSRGAPSIVGGSRDPRMRRISTSDMRQGSRFSPKVDSPMYQATRESDPNIPRALMFDRGADIMRQADLQLKSGLLTSDQHREILEQLAKLYELQRLRHMQREQHVRESMRFKRPDRVDVDVITLSPENSPKRSDREVSPERKDSSAVDSSEEKGDSVKAKEKPKTPVGDSDNEAKSSEIAETLDKQNDVETTCDKEDSVVRNANDADEIQLITTTTTKEPSRQKIRLSPIRDTSTPPARKSRFQKDSNRIHTVMIDDKPREVRFYGENAVVLLDNNDPREIAFRGPPQEVIIGDLVIKLGFSKEVKEFEIDGAKHTIRFGAPTREVIVDSQAYAAVFGGPPITVQLGEKAYQLRLNGPTPEVYFGDTSRHDFVKPSQDIDNSDRIQEHIRREGPRGGSGPPLPQHMQQHNRPGSPMRWGGSNAGRDFDPWDRKTQQQSNRDGGGRSIPQHHQRPGRDDWNDDWSGNRFNDNNDDMHRRHERGSSYRDERRMGSGILNREEFRDYDAPWNRRRGEPPVRDDFRQRGPPQFPSIRGERIGRRGSPVPDEFFDREARHSSPYREPHPSDHPRAGGYFQQQDNGRYGPPPPHMGMSQPQHRFDGPMVPPNMQSYPPGGSQQYPPGMRYGPPQFGGGRVNGAPGYQGPPGSSAGGFGFGQIGFPSGKHQFAQMQPPPQQMIAPSSIDVGDLLEKLVATGIIPGLTKSGENETTTPAVNDESSAANDVSTNNTSGQDASTVTQEETKEPVEKIPAIELNPDCLKVKYPIVISVLYCGIQCSSCGVRFTSEQTDKYAQHLDWHFRQNRREKDSARKALSRKWYYDIQDWVQFEEIEDLDERSRSFFEIQANDDQEETIDDVPASVPAGENDEDKKCAVCQELFELYWDEDHEEWHFRDAVRHDDKNYHPICLEDWNEQLRRTSIDESFEHKESSDEKENDVKPETEDIVKSEVKEAEVESVKAEITQEPECDEMVADVEAVNVERLPSVKEEPMEVVAEIKQEDTTEIKQEGSTEVKQEVAAADTVDNGGEMEPKESVENASASIEEKPEEMEIGEPLSVFNVMATSYSVPPLIAWEPEEDERMEEDVEAVTSLNDKDEQSGDPQKSAENAEQEVGSKLSEQTPVEQQTAESVYSVTVVVQENDAEDGNVMINQEVDEMADLVANDGSEVMTDDKMADVVDENSECRSIEQLTTEEQPSDPVEVSENMEQETEDNETTSAVAALLLEPVGTTVIINMPPAYDPELNFAIPESDSVDPLLDNDDSRDDYDVDGKPCGETETSESDGALNLPLTSAPVASGTSEEIAEDIELKESSDMISELEFERPITPDQATAASMAPTTAEEEDDDEDGNGCTFTVLPPVQRGTELSGLCSIM